MPTPTRIEFFEGNYYFLSNFYDAPHMFAGIEYPTTEHSFQAMKTRSQKEREAIANANTPSAAKHMGRRVTLREDWEDVKVEMMRRILRRKFDTHPKLYVQLMATGDAYLVEGNSWGDKFWGQCPVGEGHNVLGLLLMELRGLYHIKRAAKQR
jgi:ribA/ribD-fused uncharacterized protein